MIGYCSAGLEFERGDFSLPDEARDRHERVAAHTMKVIVMIGDQLQSGTPVAEDELAEQAAGDELFRRTKHRRKVAAKTPSHETVVQFLKRPGVAFAVTQNIENSGRNAGSACHKTEFRRSPDQYASHLHKSNPSVLTEI